MEYSVSIRTLGYGDYNYRRLLNSIKKQSLQPKEVNIILPQGYSPPEMILGCEKFYYTVKGMFSQRLKSIEVATTEYVFVSDDDIEFEDGFIESLMNATIANDADIVFPMFRELLPKKGIKTWMEAVLARAVPIRHKDYYVKIIGSSGYSYNRNDEDCKKVLRSESAPGMCLLLKKNIVDRIDYRDELWVDVNSYSYLDDAILVYKAHLNSMAIFAVPGLEVKHLGKCVDMTHDRRLKAAYSEPYNAVLFFLRLIHNRNNGICADAVFVYWLFSNFMFSILRTLVHKKPLNYYFVKGVCAAFKKNGTLK